MANKGFDHSDLYTMANTMQVTPEQIIEGPGQVIGDLSPMKNFHAPVDEDKRDQGEQDDDSSVHSAFGITKMLDMLIPSDRWDKACTNVQEFPPQSPIGSITDPTTADFCDYLNKLSIWVKHIYGMYILPLMQIRQLMIFESPASVTPLCSHLEARIILKDTQIILDTFQTL